jgi:hypothetical protein
LALLGSLLLLAGSPPAAGGVNLDGGVGGGPAKAAPPGALTGREVKASCWQDGVKVVELPGFAAADLGGASRDAAVLLRGRAGTVALVPLGQGGLCAIEAGSD